MNIDIKITDKQEELLSKVSHRTGRTIDELINNVIAGWIKSVEIEAKRINIEAELARLKAEKTINEAKTPAKRTIKRVTKPKPKPKKKSFLNKITDFLTGA